MLVARLLDELISTGTLRIVDAHGAVHTFGDGQGTALNVCLHDHSLGVKLFLNSKVALGEAFTEGTLTIENGDIYDLLALLTSNIGWGHGYWLMGLSDRLGRLVKRLQQYNPAGRARRNVAHHYDLSDTLYDLFLDRDRQYSCAYFMSPGDSLEKAQEQKKRHIAAKLLLTPECNVLDIGSGWGGLALYLAGIAGNKVTGVTFSREQFEVSRRRAAEAGLADRVRFRLCDYRDVSGTYDRIVSVGMLEHVGINHCKTFFRKVHDLLTEDGVALLHSIGRAEGPGATDPWIAKYIFPGGYSPALSEMLPRIEKAGLYVTDIEVLRLHYAETLREWRRRFNANRARVAELYDERFCRMWEYYLASSECSFRFLDNVVYQIQLARKQDTVPLTRDYITDWERGRDHQRSAAA